MSTSRSIYSGSTTALILFDALLIINSCILCHNFIFLLLGGLNTLLCLLFGFIFAIFWGEEHDSVRLYKSRFITSLLIILVHMLLVIVSSIFSAQLASYALGLDPLVLLASSFYIQRLQSGTVQVAADNPLHVQVEETLKPKKFDIKELIAATNNFSYLVAKSSFFMVFKGILPNGKAVGVLRHDRPKDQTSISAFVSEISNTSHCKHDNIMKIMGYCLTPEFVYFVQEGMENYRVKDWIFSVDTNKRRLLTFTIRYQVAVEVAKALDYLYNHCKNYQLDVSPSNILLSGKFKAKLVDFGLWRFLGERKNDKDDMIPEQPIDGKSLEKSKIYRYGVLLLELVSGQKHWRWCKDGEILNILYWKLKEGKLQELADPVLEINQGEQEKIELLLTVALLCVQQRAENRPTMTQVVAVLLGHENIPFLKEIPLVPMESNYDASFVSNNCSSYSDDDDVVVWYHTAATTV